jgi:hypothetical protein
MFEVTGDARKRVFLGQGSWGNSRVLVGGGNALVFTVISQVVLVCVLKRFQESSLASSPDADLFGGRRR